MADVTLSPLPRADGSANFTSNGYSVIAAVNGPIEVQRRDELPEEAAIDVAIRPAAGVGGVRERYLESILQNTLRHVILVSAHPRTLIQLTLQIISSKEGSFDAGDLLQATSNLSVLPALLQASILALLSTSIPLSMTLTATLVAVDARKFISDPTAEQLKLASSIHVFAFSSHGDLLVVESEGEFGIEIWEEAYQKARLACRGEEESYSDSEDVSMDSDNDTKLEDVLRDAVRQKVAKEQKWKQDLRSGAT